MGYKRPHRHMRSKLTQSSPRVCGNPDPSGGRTTLLARRGGVTIVMNTYIGPDVSRAGQGCATEASLILRGDRENDASARVRLWETGGIAERVTPSLSADGGQAGLLYWGGGEGGVWLDSGRRFTIEHGGSLLLEGRRGRLAIWATMLLAGSRAQAGWRACIQGRLVVDLA